MISGRRWTSSVDIRPHRRRPGRWAAGAEGNTDQRLPDTHSRSGLGGKVPSEESFPGDHEFSGRQTVATTSSLLGSFGSLDLMDRRIRSESPRNPSSRRPSIVILSVRAGRNPHDNRTGATQHRRLSVRSQQLGWCRRQQDRKRAEEPATRSDVVENARTKRRAISTPTLRFLHRRNPLAHRASVGTSASEFAASIARYSGRVWNPAESALRESLRCCVPRAGPARDSSRRSRRRDFANPCPHTPKGTESSRESRDFKSAVNVAARRYSLARGRDFRDAERGRSQGPTKSNPPVSQVCNRGRNASARRPPASRIWTPTRKTGGRAATMGISVIQALRGTTTTAM